MKQGPSQQISVALRRLGYFFVGLSIMGIVWVAAIPVSMYDATLFPYPNKTWLQSFWLGLEECFYASTAGNGWFKKSVVS